MRVQCTAEEPTLDQAKRLAIGKHYFPEKQVFHITTGKEYIVYGLSIMDGVPWVEIITDYGNLASVPLLLFQVLDHRVSKYWEMREKDNYLLFWPSSFFQAYFHDDLSERVPHVVEDFKKAQALIDAEAKGKEN